MKRVKRFVCGALASLMFVSVPVGGFAKVEAAEVVFGVTAWDILQTIMLSLGVTVSVQSSDLTSEVCQEIVDTFNLWVQQNGFDDTAQLKEDLTDLLIEGKKNVINISEKTWSALRSWAKALVNGDTQINLSNTKQNVGDMTNEFDCSSAETVNKVISNLTGGGSLDSSRIAELVKGKALLNIAYDAYYKTYKIFVLEKNTGYVLDYKYDGVPDAMYLYIVDSVGREKKYDVWGSVRRDDGSVAHDMACYSMRLGFCNWIVKNGSVCHNVEWQNVGGEAVASGAWDIITKGRTWNGEAVVGDVNIAIPEDIAGDIINVQEGSATVSDVISIADSVAIPVDTAADEAIDYPMDITETLDYADTKADDITISDTDTVAPDYDGIKDSETSGKYYVKGLQSVFPFCIPFDVIDFLGCLSAPAQAPHFKIPIKYPTLKGMETYEVDLDLSKFNDVAKIVRVCETLLFCVGLAVATRNLYIRG